MGLDVTSRRAAAALARLAALERVVGEQADVFVKLGGRDRGDRGCELGRSIMPLSPRFAAIQDHKRERDRTEGTQR